VIGESRDVHFGGGHVTVIGESRDVHLGGGHVTVIGESRDVHLGGGHVTVIGESRDVHFGGGHVTVIGESRDVHLGGGHVTVIGELRDVVEMNRCFVPESVRWLAVHGHYDAVVAQIRTICRINGRPLPEDFNPTCFVEQVIIITTFHNVILHKVKDRILTSEHSLELHNVTVFFGFIFC